MAWNPEDFASPEVKAEIRRLDTAVTSGSTGLLAPIISIKPMQLSGDRTDYFVSIKVGDREVTPHVFREEYKAAYHVALYDWLLNGSGEEPEVVEFGPKDWPARRLAAKPAEEDIARIKVQRDNALLDMERFMNEAQSAREATIEECAMACDRIEKAAEIRGNGLQPQSPGQHAAYDKAEAANTCAQAIRALSTTGEPEQ